MTRLVWLLLVACTAAFARVQPADLPVEPAEACCCCEQAGACGMPECAPPPATATVLLDRPVATARAELRREAVPPKKVAQPAFYAPLLVAPAPDRPAFTPTVDLAATAPPLRVVQCRWLI
ncbi:MAG: hypothetical protein ACO3DQ_03620 [Cephaloticoccus sp.]